MLQIVASLIDAARGIIYDHHMFIVQATEVRQAGLILALVPKFFITSFHLANSFPHPFSATAPFIRNDIQFEEDHS
jgi:hypothetical protein